MKVTVAISQVCSSRFHTKQPTDDQGWLFSAETEIPTRHKLGLQCGPQGILSPRPFKIATLLMGQDEKRAPRLGEVHIFQQVFPPRF